MRRAAVTAVKGLALNGLAILPAVPAIRGSLHLPAAEWWWPGKGPPLAALLIESVAALAVIDLSMTAIHIWWHGPLARLHATRIHHRIQEEEINYAAGQTFGPWEPVMGVPTVWANILIWGISFGPGLFATTIMMLFSLWAHTNWWPRWYRYLELVFITPVTHRVHHSPDPDFYNKNCAFVFNWDRWVFSTYERNPIWTETA